jgi:hypothetical protein
MLDTKEKSLVIRERLGVRSLVGGGAADMILSDCGADQPYYKVNLTHALVVQGVLEECVPPEEAKAFSRRAEALLEGETDALLLETFRTSPSASCRNHCRNLSKGGLHCPR